MKQKPIQFKTFFYSIVVIKRYTFNIVDYNFSDNADDSADIHSKFDKKYPGNEFNIELKILESFESERSHVLL